MMVHESVSVPMNHRDASNSSTGPWKNPPTPISVPAAGERLRPDDHKYSWHSRPVSGPAADGRPRRSHDNPYVLRNTLGRPGNPNVRKTVLAQPPVDSSVGADSRARKRQKLDTGISSIMTSAGASSSYIRGPASRTSASEPDVQVTEPPHPTSKRSNPVQNDAEIIELGTSSDDLGELVLRVKSPSADPLNIPPKLHAFETRPTEYNSSSKGKGRAREPLEIVEGSEEEDAIQEFTPPPLIPRLSYAGKSPTIPVNIVPERRRMFEGRPGSARAAIRHPAQEGVRPLDFTVIGKMKKKDEGMREHQRSTGMSDLVGTSSSNFTNSAREREKAQTLPLDAWCLGQHLFRHSEPAPLKLEYEVGSQRVKVAWGPEEIEFKLNRDARSAMIVNDTDQPLKKDIVVQFIAIPVPAWSVAERKYKGFKAGGERGRGALTFHFSTKGRGLCATGYQTFVTGIRKAFATSAVEIVKPSVGATIWTFATNYAEMFERRMSSMKEDGSERIPGEPLALTRSVTPCSSTSVKVGLELKLSNGDPGPSMSCRRSARQSALRSLRASPSPPPAAEDPDEVVLMYPPTGTGALSITYGDLWRLQPEEYLNDTLIEFGLKLWLNDLREKDPVLAEQIHVFSSFFYKKLNNRKNPDDGYKSVRKWTSKSPLFTKKYIIIPINENVHWYLAIIYEPGHTLEPPLPLLQSQLSNTRMRRKRKQKQEHTQALSEMPREGSLERLNPAHSTDGEPEVDTPSMDATRATTPSVTENKGMDDAAITGFDQSCSITAAEPASSEIQVRDSSPNLVHPPSDSMDVDADTSVTDVLPPFEMAQVTEASTSKSGIPVSQFYGSAHKPEDVQPIVTEDNENSSEDQQQEAEVDNMLTVTQSPTGNLPQTYIFTLDSLGTRHPQAIKVLRQYLKSEAKDKHNFDEVREAVGKQVQVPVQPNTWDCGMYLLHFVKVFMSAPSEFVEQIFSTRGTMPSSERKKMWQDHEIPQSRDYLHSRILQLSEEWKTEKTVREEEANRRRSRDAQEVETLSSDGEVDIVEDIPSVKATPGPKQKQPAARLRG